MQLIKFYLILVIITFIFSSGTLYSQQTDYLKEINPSDPELIPKSLLNRITVNLDSTSIEHALDFISQEGSFYLNYNRNRIPFDKKISVDMIDQKALDVLLFVLEDTDAKLMTTSDGQMIIEPLDNTKHRTGIVTGHVVDEETQNPLIGTNIEVVGKGMGGATDNNGNFYISQLPDGEYTLEFSYIGYESKKIDRIKISAD